MIDDAVLRIRQLIETRQIDDAQSIYVEHLSGNPQALFEHANYLAVHAYDRGFAAVAISWFEDVLRIHPENATALFNLGPIYAFHAHDHRTIAKAREYLRRALAVLPDDARVLVWLGETCLRIGPLEEALTCLTKAVELDPSSARAQHQLGHAFAELGDLDAAERHLRLAAEIDPTYVEKIAKDLTDIEAAKKEKAGRRSIIARYPTSDAIQNSLKQTILKDVVAGHLGAGKFLDADTRFYTMGSCFAARIGRALRKMGHKANTLGIAENINTSFANRRLIDWVLGEDVGKIAERIQEIAGDTRREEILEELSSADVFIYTMGVAPCFFENDSGAFVMPRPSAINTRALAEQYTYRTTTVQENVDNLAHVFDRLTAINPKMKIFLTVSPVPLQVTFEFKSAVVADCLSKSTLRVAAQQLLETSKANLHYWPTFEIVRWLGAHTGPVFGTEDGAAWHVSEALVDLIVSTFVESFKKS